MRHLLILSILFLYSPGLLAKDGEKNPEIEYLLQKVGESGCIFIRNGKEHSSEDAESHLRLKYRRGRKYADTAEQFIERLASKSSWSGDIYYIRCDDSDQQPSGDWLSDRLAEYKQSK